MRLILLLLAIFVLVSCDKQATSKPSDQKKDEKKDEKKKRGIDIESNDTIEEKRVVRRIALVIGNSAYKHSPLKNPVNDATDIGAILTKLGFEVTVKTNSSRSQMRKAIRKFGNDLKKGGVGLFYYAGHGMQVKGINYLIPVGADIAEEDEVQDETIDAGSVLRKMESAGNSMNMVFLDACRNNPFARSFRSSVRGLAQMDAPSGSLIVYATAPGSTAADGDGRNGVFTQCFLKHINTSDLEIGRLLRKVRVDVKKQTNSRQIPWESSSLEGDFYFLKSKTQTLKVTQKPIAKLVKVDNKEKENNDYTWVRDRVDFLLEEGRYEDALEFLKETKSQVSTPTDKSWLDKEISRLEQELGGDDEKLIMSSLKEADQFSRQHRYKEAIAILQEAKNKVTLSVNQERLNKEIYRIEHHHMDYEKTLIISSLREAEQFSKQHRHKEAIAILRETQNKVTLSANQERLSEEIHWRVKSLPFD